MTQAQRERIRPEAAAIPAPAGAEGAIQEPLRKAGRDFLSAAERAIRKALSSNSEQFLMASEQEGGQ